MRTTAIFFACAIAAAGVGGSAAAQGYGGHHGYDGYHPARPKAYAAPPFPEQPKPPKPPEFAAPRPFKPFTGQHVDSARGGRDAYPAAPKPKGGFSTYGR